jgi:hypothetical protein
MAKMGLGLAVLRRVARGGVWLVLIVAAFLRIGYGPHLSPLLASKQAACVHHNAAQHIKKASKKLVIPTQF